MRSAGNSGRRRAAVEPSQHARPRWLAAATVAEYGRLRKGARCPPDEVDRDQQARLQVMVAHARRHVAMYRDLYADVSKAKPVELHDLPLVDKPTIRACSMAERRAGPAPSLTLRLVTSGTTGEPLMVDWSPRAAWWQGVLTMRMAYHQGLPPTHRRAMVLGPSDGRPSGRGVFGAMRSRHVRLPATQSPELLARALEKQRPHALFGHGHLLLEIAEQLSGTWRPSVINPAGEQLTHENRAALRRAYGSEPLDVYSSSEQGVPAWQCRAADLYHINHEAVVIEVLGKNGEQLPPGALGELVITGLWNPLMPFLRYRTGDAGVLATRPCRCGSILPALERVEGRMMDWLVDASGQRVAPQRLWLSAHLPDGLSLIHRYQVRQDPAGHVTVLLNPRTEIGLDVVRQLEQSYQRLLGPSIAIRVRLTDRIENEASGKFRTIVAQHADVFHGSGED